MGRLARAAAILALGSAALGTGPAPRDALAEPPAGNPAPPAQPRWLGPRTGAERTKALARYGADATVEKAVAAGLDWLARHQGEDGRWDADGFSARCAGTGPKCAGAGKGQHGEDSPCPFDDAISGLATLAFLGNGHLPGAEGDAAHHGPVVEKALAALSSASDPWAVPIAVQAYAEAEAMERRGRFLARAREGAARLLAARGADGAWGYATGMRTGSDVPCSGFVVQALVAARDVGVELPADLASKADAFLSSLEEKNGRLAYLLDGRAFGYTPTSANAHTAAAIRELLEVGTGGARHRAHMGLLAKEAPVWKISFKEVEVPGQGRMKVQVGYLSLYQWWYGTMAEFQAGGEGWTAWYGKAKAALLGHQRKTTECARGSWDPEGTYERQTGGRVFATALAVLILEEPWRHRRLGS